MRQRNSMFHMLFGEQAETARKMAPERLLRWSGCFDRWVEERMAVSQKSGRMAVRAWDELLTFVHKPPWEVEEGDVIAYSGWLKSNSAGPFKITKRVRALAMFYRFAETELGEGVEDPTMGVERSTNWLHLRADYLSREEAWALLQAIDRETSVLGKRDYALILGRLTCGLTTGDLLGLKWGDLEVDWERREASARRASPGRPRAAIPIEVVRAIWDYLQAAGRLEGLQADSRIFAPLRNVLSKQYFTRAEDWEEKRSLSHVAFWAQLRRYARWAGLDDRRVNVNTLTHTALMLRVEAGDSQEEMQAFFDYQDEDHVRKMLHRLTSREKEELWRMTSTGERDTETGGRGEGETRGRGDGETRRSGEMETRREGEREKYQRRPYASELAPSGLKHGLYARALPRGELEEAAQMGSEGVDDEINALRVVMMRTLQQAIHSGAEGDEKADTVTIQLRLLEVFSAAAQRLSGLLKTQRELGGGASALEETLQAISEEILIERGWPPAGGQRPLPGGQRQAMDDQRPEPDDHEAGDG